jgi:hypothetical protein
LKKLPEPLRSEVSHLTQSPRPYQTITIEETGKTLGMTFLDPEVPPIVNLVDAFDLKHHDVAALYDFKLPEELRHLLLHATEFIDGLELSGNIDNRVVVFDIDDTLLTTYPEMESRSFGTLPTLDLEFLLNHHLPAISQTRDFYKYLVERKKIGVILLSERQAALRDMTVENLKQQGFHGYERLILREKDEPFGSCVDFKSRWRSRIVAEGKNIVCCVGDQQSDLCGGNTGLQVKIPNYMYTID